MIAGLTAVAACVILGAVSVFQDDCTGSFDRSPRDVVLSYAEAVGQGESTVVRKCWVPEPYFSLDAGCTEICLSRVLGANFQIQDIRLGEPALTPEGRARIESSVTVTCPTAGDPLTGEILLDGISRDVPWRHWKIIHSTVGGTNAEPWCK
jgi:hypothetical protein